MQIKDLTKEAVVLPTMQGMVVGGFFAGGITASTLAAEHASGSPFLPWQYTLSASFCLISGIAVLALQNKWANHYFPDNRPQTSVQKEYATNPTKMVVLETPENQAYAKGSIVDLPEGIHQHQIHRAAMLIVHSGWSFSHALLSGMNRPFTRKQYELFRDMVCFPREWITWKNSYAHNQGVCVLRAGQNAFRYLSSPTNRQPMPN